MPEAAKYSATEALRDGSRVEIRALRPDDRAAVLAAVDHTSSKSLYRRFFAARRSFTESEIALFLNVDFTSHVALVAAVRPAVAIDPQQHRAVGLVRWRAVPDGLPDLCDDALSAPTPRRVGPASFFQSHKFIDCS